MTFNNYIEENPGKFSQNIEDLRSPMGLYLLLLFIKKKKKDESAGLSICTTRSNFIGSSIDIEQIVNEGLFHSDEISETDEEKASPKGIKK
ncbi:12104_t:CDS:2 [Funneliformis mosseae]|uniref:12104_t:CDS:1 n=1 Tax=Funneliformis mosseae TaxID=27381 RepID=A0A9N9DW63_FUNMO|nr:12104_t:CDS:2 [Funneliformis mosseae]